MTKITQSFSLFLISLIRLYSQEINTKDLLYANVYENISHLSFNADGSYVGVVNDTSLVLFDNQNLQKPKINLFKTKIGTVGDWYNLEKLEYTNDTIITYTINGIKYFLDKEDSLKEISRKNRISLFKDIGVPQDQLDTYFDITSFNGWFFYYKDLAKKGNKIKPRLYAIKGKRKESLQLSEVKIDYNKQKHVWHKNPSILKAAYNNHYEKGNKNIYFSFPYQNKLVVFNTDYGKFSEISIPFFKKTNPWFVFTDSSTKIPFLAVEVNEIYKVYYLNKDLEFVYLMQADHKPLNFVDYKVHYKVEYEDSGKKYFAHYLKQIEK